MLVIRKIFFLVLGEVPTDGINDGFCVAEKKFSINLSKTKDKILLTFTLQW